VSSRLRGPATRSAAVADGITPWQLRHRDVVRLSRDTYLPGAAVGDLRARIAAVLLTAPELAVVSHLTAAALWGLAIPMGKDDARVHLTVPTGSAVRGRADRVIHRSPWERDEVGRLDVFPVTTPARTWRDLAMILPPAALLAVSDQLLDGRCTTSQLADQLARRPTGRGAARARAVLPVAGEPAESPMESVLRWVIHEAGLPTPVVQHVVTMGGRFVARADLAWPQKKVIVEFDGDVHRDRAVFVNDLRRQNELIAAGWTVLRFTSADVLGRPAEVVAAIRRALLG
jgi:very-short-patch-repair endonuclease